MQRITNSAWVGEKFDVYAHFDVDKYINKITSKAGSKFGIYKHTDVKARKPLAKKSALVKEGF